MTTVENLEKLREAEQETLPHLLDIVLVDDEWAQVVGGLESNGITIKYLSNKKVKIIYLDEYKLIRKIRKPVSMVKKEIPFTDEELRNAHYTAELNNDPRAKDGIEIFGEYRKKK